MIFILSGGFTLIAILTQGILKGNDNIVLAILVLVLVYIVNAGYGGGFSNVPTLLSDHYGMGSISAIHGITLSAWAFAGLTGNQAAAFIVKHFGKEETITYLEKGVEHTVTVNPTGYHNVLIFTIVLYVLAMLACLISVKPTKKKAE